MVEEIPHDYPISVCFCNDIISKQVKVFLSPSFAKSSKARSSWKDPVDIS